MTVLEPVVQFLMEYRGKKVSLDQAMNGADRPRKPVLRVMDRLVREGYLEEIEDDAIPPARGECGPPRRNPSWRIISKPLLEIAQRQPKKKTLRDRLWLLVRARRRFTRRELQRLSGVSMASSDNFTKLLFKNGYVREIGKDAGEKVYMLIKDPGPTRPIMKENIND
jgi:hypothetical protein